MTHMSRLKKLRLIEFLVSDEITVVTRSVQPGHPAIRWTGKDLPGVMAFPVMRQGFGSNADKPLQFVIGGGTYAQLAEWRDKQQDKQQSAEQKPAKKTSKKD